MLAALPQARVVGGAVRDALAGQAVADVDLATPEPPEQVVRALEAAGLGWAPTGLLHGTVTALSRGRPFEVTTLRRDERTDGRHAEVAWTGDWREDAARRDFTINAMSMSREGEVYDYFGGVADLRAGRVRFVGEASRRVAEDYLRVLRYFRFYARYERGQPDEATAAALSGGAGGLQQLSVERVWSELKRILQVPEPPGRVVEAVRLMEALGVLDALLLAPVDQEGLARLVQAGAPAGPLLRLAALFPGAADLGERFKLSRQEVGTLCGLAGPAPNPEWDEDGLRRALAEEPAAAMIGRAWLAQGQPGDWAGLRARMAAMAVPVFPLGGRDAVALGIAPGPGVGALLAQVRAWWLASGCQADADACRAELARLARH